jgi:hypothetical protein
MTDNNSSSPFAQDRAVRTANTIAGAVEDAIKTAVEDTLSQMRPYLVRLLRDECADVTRQAVNETKGGDGAS